MNQEDKELLFKDLCARLPYGVKICYIEPEYKIKSVCNVDYIYPNGNIVCKTPYAVHNIENCLLYLRSMSSMTEEEKKEFNSLINGVEERCINAYGKGGYTLAFIEVNDWLNAHHFDYRGLIPMDLAIEVTEENNPYKK